MGEPKPPQSKSKSSRGGITVRRRESLLLSRIVSSLSEGHVKKGKKAQEEPNLLFLKQNRVVGRERELLLLNDVYKRVSTSRSEVVTIHGPSGTGKSTLIEAFVRELPPNAGFFVSGKFDQLQSHAPYAALVSACDQLCRQALRRENSCDIRNRIRELLGPEINLLGSLIPIIGKITAAETKADGKTGDGDTSSNTHGGEQGFTRFKLLFQAFLRCVASSKNPVILFLDDIQWADSASLEVLRSLVTDSLSKYIMIVGAYREGELTSSLLHKYNLSNENADSSCDDDTECSSSAYSAQVTDIGVVGLDIKSLNTLISSVLAMEEDAILSLSTLVLNKTSGNAFYVLNFLDMLLSRSLLTKSEGGSWIWDEKRILQETNVSDNLAAILKTKLRDLPEQVRSILQIASFIGHSFTIEVLSTIVFEEQDMIEKDYSFDKHTKEVIHDRIVATLKVAVVEGLLETSAETDEYKFSHDKVQQCLYLDLMPDNVERGLLHQRIGSLIWNSVKSGEPSDDFDDWVFLAAENLNRAVNLADYSEMQHELIEVNLRAAKLAIAKSAFHLASSYLRTAVKLLEGDACWRNHYALCIDLFSTAAKAEKNIANYDRSTDLVNAIHEHAQSHRHQLEAYTIQVESLALQGNLEGSIKLGIEVLRKSGVKFPKKINAGTVAKELMMAKMAIGKRSLNDLLQLPAMKDQDKILVLDLMEFVAMNAFLLGNSYKETSVSMSTRMVRMTIKYGLSTTSPMAFAGYGVVLSVLGRFDVAIQVEKLALDIIDKLNAESVRGRVVNVSYSLIHLWRNNLDDGVRDDFLQAYHLAMSYGDVAHAHIGFVSWLVSGMNLNAPLNEIHKRTRAVAAEGREYKKGTLLSFVLPVWQVLLNISGDPQNPDPSCMMGEAFDQDFSMEMKNVNSKIALFAAHICELKLAYTYENWDDALRILPLSRQLEKDGEGYFDIGFSYSWIAASHYELYLASGKRKHKREGRRCHSKVTKWATSGTVMLSGVSEWLEAVEGLCAKNNSVEEVEALFEGAFAALAANKNTFFEALANERLARLFLTEQRPEVQDVSKGHKYLQRAIRLYSRWGALAKAEWLKERYINH